MRESSMKGSAILQFRQEVERQLRDQSLVRPLRWRWTKSSQPR